MGSLFDWITDWIKEGLIEAITGQYTSIFESVNSQVADVAGQVGQTPQGWNGGVFSMIQNLSETVVIPIAGIILTFVLVYELIQMILEKNNMHDFDTFNIFKWIFKTFVATYLLTNCFTIVMAVFDVAQHVVSQSAGVINGNLDVTAEFPIVKDTTPNMMNPRLYTTSYNKPQGQQFDTAVLSFIKLQYTEKSCKMINIFVLVTILGHLPVILSAKSKGSENMKQILIVEDDSFLNKMLAYNLTADGYGVTSALNARTAAEAIRQREFDLVLLDINLPDGNGFELCKLIKPQHPDTIVIFLTANDQESDQIRGYEVGAVDYITKPFVIGALQRKIKAMFAMLEHHKPAKDIYDDGRLFLDFSEQTASLNGKPLTLSPMEYKMLNLFRKNPRQVLTRGQLLEKLWDIDERFVDEHTLTTSISRIRSKIESDGGAPYIKTVYGMGYQWTGGEAK